MVREEPAPGLPKYALMEIDIVNYFPHDLAPVSMAYFDLTKPWRYVMTLHLGKPPGFNPPDQHCILGRLRPDKYRTSMSFAIGIKLLCFIS
jgi:hypothetical protein